MIASVAVYMGAAVAEIAGCFLRDPLIFNLNNGLQLVDLKIILGVLTITMRTGDESSTGASAG
ncbi:MAG: hypothetical protein U5S82_18965 [Gammaproteobacteria bacterium]|nr:hypothetical protein [Gammaproteobacteria bacterium]